uniref:Uncharacterized protein n=1 Tax=Calcidiscus leptoporus TaxID=127549 RepID=A0A7S0JBQ1_9EUKA|mmetsp:Transcript_49950/g.115295  ORF Transcript_49950/g.115295 Transcript_49950/m.115295 type:complete len:252 (+) Transcript_49950:93-848(+)
MLGSAVLLLAAFMMFIGSATALLLPSAERCIGTRRGVLQAAASVVIAPIISRPGAADAAVYDDRIGSGFGGTGALRSDIGPSVLGEGVEILVTDLSYQELNACPSNFFIPPKGGPWTCLEISATALNQGRQKKASAAEVFGQLYDAEGFACLATALDPTQKSPIASISEPFPQGQPKKITFLAAVQSRSPRPFRFAGFKADYRNARMEKVYERFDPCEIDSSQCDDPLDQPENGKALREGKGFEYKAGVKK